ncbi:carbohydrate porin [Magnetospirillum molischianum]|uniref:Carbohydrate-selective porin n=1 Tax=Magnetospirillum molischianum DSM 120 TaxID=1150626 RepID=H8FX91_MAGML|nr:carbohydrate porin [Magnetospirillum molischianum]CCG42979.1 Carbohydrate-selective porin [Magnetospirillum molischianum DSM 120]
MRTDIIRDQSGEELMQQHNGTGPAATDKERPGKTGVRALLGLAAVMGGLATTPAMAQEEGGAGFWGRDTLTGDWGGVRSNLEEKGITVSATYTGEALGNVSGGLRQRAVASGLLQADVEADLEKAVGWQGGLFHFTGLYTHGRSLSANFLQNWIPSRDIETAPNTRLFALWLQQSFFDDMVSLKAGVVPMQEEFFNSEYAANLIGSPFGWPGSFALNYPGGGGYPLSGPGTRVKVKPTENLAILAAVFSGDTAPGAADSRSDDPARRNSSGTDFSLEAPTWFGEVQYGINQEKDAKALPTMIKVGGWYHNHSYNDLRYAENGESLAFMPDGTPAQRHRGNWAAYAILDQMLWRRPGDTGGGLGFFVRGTVMPDDRNQAPYYVDTGLVLKGTFEGRDDDVAAIGFAYAGASDRLASLDGDLRAAGRSTAKDHDYETMLEVSYRYKVTPWWTLVPDAQYIMHPGGSRDHVDSNNETIKDAVILGLRTVFTL